MMVTSSGFRALALGLIILGPTSCGGPAGSPEPNDGLVDDRGIEHAATPLRRRVLSLVPGMTETLVAMGATDALIARTRYDEQPELAHLPSVGGGLDPSLEFVADLDPDLVLTWGDGGGTGSLSARLGHLGIETYQVEVEGLDDFRRHTGNLGVLTGRVEQAEALVSGVDLGLERTAAAVSSAPAPTVLYVAQIEPPMGAGPGTFIDSIIAVAGGINVLADVTGDWPMLSIEDILWRNPDYVVVPQLGLSRSPPEARTSEGGGGPPSGGDGPPASVRRLTEGAGWSEVDAVRAGRIIAVDANMFGRPGPRMAEAARYLASRLHPDLVAPNPKNR